MNNSFKYFLLLLFIPLWIFIYFNLDGFASYFVYNFLGFNKNDHLSEALRFFIFEVPKVLLLLILIVFFVGILRSFFSPKKTRKALEGKPLLIGNTLAALLGIVTPFCSCSAIPLFLGFVEAGIPLGVTFSFLIAAPMINEVAVILLFGLFGWKTTLLYISTGLIIAVISGYVIEKLNLYKYVESWVYKIKSENSGIEEKNLVFSERIDFALNAVKDIVAKVWIYIAIGIAVGAGVHGYVPENFMASLMGKDAWWSVPLAVLIGIPMYSNAAGIVPVIQVLIGKGASIGTALAFMMSVISLSLPEMIILKKVLKTRLIFIFIGIVAAGIIIVGYLFNLIF